MPDPKVKDKESLSEVINPEDVITDGDIETVKTGGKEVSPTLEVSEEEQTHFEALSSDDRALIEEEGAKFVDGEYRVPVSHIAKQRQRTREAEQKTRDTTTALETMRYQAQNVAPPPDTNYTQEQIDEFRENNPDGYQRWIARQETRAELRDNSLRQQQLNVFKLKANAINEAERKTLIEFPELDNKNEKYDPVFANETKNEAIALGHLTYVPDDRGEMRVEYISPDAFGLGARSIAEKKGLEKKQTENLSETLRTNRMKKTVTTKEGGKQKTGEGGKALTKDQLKLCREQNIDPKLYGQFLGKQEVTV